MSFSKKTAFVTGAGGGMGLRIASDLLREGANVLLFDIKPQPDNIPGEAQQWRYVQADLINEAAVIAAAAQAFEVFGGTELLVDGGLQAKP